VGLSGGTAEAEKTAAVGAGSSAPLAPARGLFFGLESEAKLDGLAAAAASCVRGCISSSAAAAADAAADPLRLFPPRDWDQGSSASGEGSAALEAEAAEAAADVAAEAEGEVGSTLAIGGGSTATRRRAAGAVTAPAAAEGAANDGPTTGFA
jgi:hypothetical protein